MVVSLDIKNLRSFLHSSNNKWMSSMNYGEKWDPEHWLLTQTNQKYSDYLHYYYVILHLPINDYFFPDEDFCLFQYFPYTQLVLPLLTNRNRPDQLTNDYKHLEISCTLAYLLQYSFALINQTRWTFSGTIFCLS